MGQVRDVAEKLYETGALLGFTISSHEGEMVHNESFFSDDAANQVVATFSSCMEGLATSGRIVKRLTMELDDLIVIFIEITDRNRRGMFLLTRSCHLDTASDTLAELAE